MQLKTFMAFICGVVPRQSQQHQYYHIPAHCGIMVFMGMNTLLTLFDIMIIWNTRTFQLTNAEDGVNTWLYWNHIRILRNSMNGSMSMAKEHTNVHGRNVIARNSGCPRFIPGSCKKIHNVTPWNVSWKKRCSNAGFTYAENKRILL